MIGSCGFILNPTIAIHLSTCIRPKGASQCCSQCICVSPWNNSKKVQYYLTQRQRQGQIIMCEFLSRKLQYFLWLGIIIISHGRQNMVKHIDTQIWEMQRLITLRLWSEANLSWNVTIGFHFHGINMWLFLARL